MATSGTVTGAWPERAGAMAMRLELTGAGWLLVRVAAGLALCALSGGQSLGQSAPVASLTPAAAPNATLKPYLAQTALPDSVALLKPPPAAKSPAEARDQALARAAHALLGKPRWDQAKRDADLFSPRATSGFSCAAGREISPSATPVTDRLLRRAMIDFAAATSAAKAKYQRARPFMTDGKPICTPDMAAGLRANGSYPSGHAAIGQGWGLVLAALVPAHKAALLARGKDFGDSRRVCNVHWASDVAAGQVVAQATYRVLLKDTAFSTDLAAARTELANVRPIVPDCTAEKAGLKR
ncbi:phosphatase PAP2 family protein [Novosphingobium sp. FKTRR1]|uniref:acid phosphatase n=1 Tax=Novosphingobium sp. FKTRR1 TaxID=2879118 RepID=UPI001CEFD0BB|nr:phosphatase PAP2 family protein [Novosphingobium sp. FKTRR1]